MTDPTPGEGQRIAAAARALGLQKHPSQAASEAVEAVLQLHTPDTMPSGVKHCSECANDYHDDWPCDTVKAVRKHIPELTRTKGERRG